MKEEIVDPSLSRASSERKPSLVEFLQTSPLAGIDLEIIERDRSLPRPFDLYE
jgi:hypothetical protein